MVAEVGWNLSSEGKGRQCLQGAANVFPPPNARAVLASDILDTYILILMFESIVQVHRILHVFSTTTTYNQCIKKRNIRKKGLSFSIGCALFWSGRVKGESGSEDLLFRWPFFHLLFAKVGKSIPRPILQKLSKRWFWPFLIFLSIYYLAWAKPFMQYYFQMPWFRIWSQFSFISLLREMHSKVSEIQSLPFFEISMCVAQNVACQDCSGVWRWEWMSTAQCRGHIFGSRLHQL